jgi:hypothetical protein
MVVLVPRFVLASLAGYVEWRLSKNFPISLDDAYFQRILRNFSCGPERVRVVPFSYTMPEAARAGLESIVSRVFGGNAALMLEPPIRWAEDSIAVERLPTSGTGPVIAVFNLTATPESEVHGAFLNALKARCHAGHGFIVLIDESAFRTRWPDDETRMIQRREIWKALLSEYRLNPVFTSLVAPDLHAVNSDFDVALHSSIDR